MGKVSPLKLFVRFTEDVSVVDLSLGRGRYNELIYTTGFGDDSSAADFLTCYSENLAST